VYELSNVVLVGAAAFTLAGCVLEDFGLKGKDAVSQFVTMLKMLEYSTFDFVCEVSANRKAVYLNFLLWTQVDFTPLGMGQAQRNATIARLKGSVGIEPHRNTTSGVPVNAKPTIEETLDSLPQEFRSTMYRTDGLFQVGGHSDATSSFRRRLGRNLPVPCPTNHSSTCATRSPSRATRSRLHS